MKYQFYVVSSEEQSTLHYCTLVPKPDLWLYLRIHDR